MQNYHVVLDRMIDSEYNKSLAVNENDKYNDEITIAVPMEEIFTHYATKSNIKS